MFVTKGLFREIYCRTILFSTDMYNRYTENYTQYGENLYS